MVRAGLLGSILRALTSVERMKGGDTLVLLLRLGWGSVSAVADPGQVGVREPFCPAPRPCQAGERVTDLVICVTIAPAPPECSQGTPFMWGAAQIPPNGIPPAGHADQLPSNRGWGPAMLGRGRPPSSEQPPSEEPRQSAGDRKDRSLGAEPGGEPRRPGWEFPGMELQDLDGERLPQVVAERTGLHGDLAPTPPARWHGG